MRHLEVRQLQLQPLHSDKNRIHCWKRELCQSKTYNTYTTNIYTCQNFGSTRSARESRGRYRVGSTGLATGPCMHFL
jgi:hypothetical protein